MRDVILASIATANPMGQQVYERELLRALHSMDQEAWRVKDVRVASLRSPATGVRRSPSGLLSTATLSVAFSLGALTYRSTGLVHRLDLRLPPHPGKEVVTIHDLPLFHFPDEGQLPRSAAAGARRARVVICPSEFAAREVRQLLDVTRIEVIPYGLSPVFREVVPANEARLVDFGLEAGQFVLHAAGATERKNLQELARAWARVSSKNNRVRLVLAGPQDARRDRAFAGLERVVMPGKLPPSTIGALMARAAFVVVPSVYEGFGLPALEAMASGAPVLASRAGALPEVCGDAALLVEPTRDGLAEGMLCLLSDASRSEDLRARGRERSKAFSWSTAAERHISVYEDATSG